MRKVKLYIVEKTTTTNSIGEPITSFEKTDKAFWSDYLIPVDSRFTKYLKDWGFDPLKVVETRTRADVEENSYVKLDDDIYHIQKTLKYPRFHHLFLERVSVND